MSNAGVHSNKYCAPHFKSSCNVTNMEDDKNMKHTLNTQTYGEG